MSEILTRERILLLSTWIPKNRGQEEYLVHDAAQRAEIERSHDAILHLTGENERLREALRFYADPQTYGMNGGASARILADAGKRARAAIAGEKEKP